MAARVASNLILCYSFPHTFTLKPPTKMDDHTNVSSVSSEEDGFWSPDTEGYTEEESGSEAPTPPPPARSSPLPSWHREIEKKRKIEAQLKTLKKELKENRKELVGVRNRKIKMLCLLLESLKIRDLKKLQARIQTTITMKMLQERI